MTKRLRRDRREMLDALEELGGRATTRQLCKKVNLQPQGLSRSMGALEKSDLVKRLNKRGADTEWELTDKGREIDKTAQQPLDI